MSEQNLLKVLSVDGYRVRWLNKLDYFKSIKFMEEYKVYGKRDGAIAEEAAV